jgi:hypothetical protein
LTPKNHSGDILKFGSYAVLKQKVSHGLFPFTKINLVLLFGKSIALNYETPTIYIYIYIYLYFMLDSRFGNINKRGSIL